MGMTSLYPNFFYLVFSAEALLHSIHGDLVFLEKIIVSSNLSSLTSFSSSSSLFSHTEQRNRSVLPQGVSSDGSVHYEIEVFLSSNNNARDCALQRNEPLCFVGAQTHVFPIMLLLLSRPSESVDHEFLNGRSCLVSAVVLVFHLTAKRIFGRKKTWEIKIL
ncbi:hypothetical protein DY000_02063733 [Brassica cretica]|uniref:Uncharacterized protein n=1 Tax=Brassica cretica TaxID=69181 RepID=A0ABQ7APT3_BRACR|nr:hypothetical protein DY000_02063733 [Brassica cretica]